LLIDTDTIITGAVKDLPEQAGNFYLYIAKKRRDVQPARLFVLYQIIFK
jgi:hypothetical protein